MFGSSLRKTAVKAMVEAYFDQAWRASQAPATSPTILLERDAARKLEEDHGIRFQGFNALPSNRDASLAVVVPPVVPSSVTLSGKTASHLSNVARNVFAFLLTLVFGGLAFGLGRLAFDGTGEPLGWRLFWLFWGMVFAGVILILVVYGFGEFDLTIGSTESQPTDQKDSAEKEEEDPPAQGSDGDEDSAEKEDEGPPAKGSGKP